MAFDADDDNDNCWKLKNDDHLGEVDGDNDGDGDGGNDVDDDDDALGTFYY